MLGRLTVMAYARPQHLSNCDEEHRMRITEMTIPGAYRVEPELHLDVRGRFFESVTSSGLLAGTGWDLTVRQVNFSVSRRNTVRGVHGTTLPPGQAKFITCVRGLA